MGERKWMDGRLDEAILERFLDYGDRVLHVVETLERVCRLRRVIDQLTGSGTSPGAHMFEAHEAVSRADFVKLLGGAAKELSETRYWLMLIVRRKWITAQRIDPLLDETRQLLRIVKAMNARTRGKDRKGKPPGKRS